MKLLNFLNKRKELIFIVLFLTNHIITLAQPVGATKANPINIGTITYGSTYADTKNNSPSNGYLNNYGQSSDDIFYKFTIEASLEVSISHCSSSFDTYMYVLNTNDAVVGSNDDYGVLCPTTRQASLKLQLPAGTYYIVSEGYSSLTGNITTSVSIANNTEVDDSFSTRVNSIFQNVNRAEVTSGILLDYGVEFQNMDNYSGMALHDSNYVNINDWRSIVSTLGSSQFNNQAVLPTLTAINSSISSSESSSLPNPFVVLNFKYHALRPDAISAGLMTSSNDKLYDVPNRTTSPYVLKYVFAISPTKKQYDAPDGVISFTIPSTLIFGNSGKTISQVKVNMGDGLGLRNVSTGVAFTSNYASSGIKDLNYQVTYTDATVYNGHSQVYINRTQSTPAQVQFKPMTTVRISASTSNGTKYATLQIQLSNHNPGSKIIKPFIISEGIDFWKIASPNDTESNMDIRTFLREANSIHSPTPNLTLAEWLDTNGYDLVFIDFDEATDYLENNSALVRAAIARVNSDKYPSVQQNVVMGISMGAVLARHALRTMEVNGTPHQTRLYISLDGPHQGANFPLGLQAMIQHLSIAMLRIPFATLFSFSDMFPELNTGRAILNSPAVKQLTIYSLKYSAGSFSMDNTAHNNFYSSYRTLGYPTQCRNIAISNGSECGKAQNFPPYTTIFAQKESFRIPYLFDAATSWVQALLIFSNRPTLGLYAPLSLLSTKTSFNIDFDVKTLPDHSVQRIYKGTVGIKRKILGLFNVNANITNKDFYSTSSMLPLDNGVGGEANLLDNNIGIPSSLSSLLSIPSFCYIPAFSSLDLGGGNTAINTAQLMGGYSQSSPPAAPYAVPFNNFITGSFVNGVPRNEGHPELTARNGRFLTKELVSDTSPMSNCAFLCSNVVISGPAAYCSNSTYTINNPANTTVTWTTTGSGFTVPPNSSGSSVTITGSYGSGTLNARIMSECGVRIITKDLAFTNLTYETLYDRTPQSSNYQYVTITANIIEGTPQVNYRWYKEESNGSLTYISSGNQLRLYPIPPCSAVYFRLEVSTPCGLLYVRPYGYNTSCPSGGMTAMQSFTAFPNPTNNELMVTEVEEQENASSSTGRAETLHNYEVYLIDQKGEKLISVKSRNKEVKLNTSNIPNGIYFLHIIKGNKIEKKQIIINH